MLSFKWIFWIRSFLFSRFTSSAACIHNQNWDKKLLSTSSIARGITISSECATFTFPVKDFLDILYMVMADRSRLLDFGTRGFGLSQKNDLEKGVTLWPESQFLIRVAENFRTNWSWTSIWLRLSKTDRRSNKVENGSSWVSSYTIKDFSFRSGKKRIRTAKVSLAVGNCLVNL